MDEEALRELFRKTFRRCHGCGIDVLGSSLRRGKDGLGYCEDCWEAAHLVCPRCGVLLMAHEAESFGGVLHCRYCYEHLMMEVVEGR